MDDLHIFAAMCLIFGTVVASQIPRRWRASDGGIVGRIVSLLFLLSLAAFLLSLGGAGVALLLRMANLAYALEGAAVVSGFGVRGFPLVAALVAVLASLVRSLVRRGQGIRG